MIIPVGRTPIYIPNYRHYRRHYNDGDQNVFEVKSVHSPLCVIISMFVGVMSACVVFYLLREEADNFVGAMLIGVLGAVVGFFMFALSLMICTTIFG